MRRESAPDSIFTFNYDFQFADREPVFVYDDYGRRAYVGTRGIGDWVSSTVTMQIDVPKEVVTQPDRDLATIAYIKRLLTEWENTLKNPDINGREPQLGGK